MCFVLIQCFVFAFEYMSAVAAAQSMFYLSVPIHVVFSLHLSMTSSVQFLTTRLMSLQK